MRLRKIIKLVKGKDRKDKNSFSIDSWVEIMGGKWTDYILQLLTRKDNLTFIQHVKICTVCLTSYYLPPFEPIEVGFVFISWEFKMSTFSTALILWVVSTHHWLLSFKRPKFLKHLCCLMHYHKIPGRGVMSKWREFKQLLRLLCGKIKLQKKFRKYSSDSRGMKRDWMSTGIMKEVESSGQLDTNGESRGNPLVFLSRKLTVSYM